MVGDSACRAAESAFSAPVYAALLGPASESGLELTVGLSYLENMHLSIYVYVCTRGPCFCAVASDYVIVIQLQSDKRWNFSLTLPETGEDYAKFCAGL